MEVNTTKCVPLNDTCVEGMTLTAYCSDKMQKINYFIDIYSCLS